MSKKQGKKQRGNFTSSPTPSKQSPALENSCTSPATPSASPIFGGAGGGAEELPILLRITELAKMLNVSVRTVQRLEKINHIPGRVTLGRNIRYARVAIEKWIHDKITSNKNDIN